VGADRHLIKPRGVLPPPAQTRQRRRVAGLDDLLPAVPALPERSRPVQQVADLAEFGAHLVEGVRGQHGQDAFEFSPAPDQFGLGHGAHINVHPPNLAPRAWSSAEESALARGDAR
jgi:hypothetical protein